MLCVSSVWAVALRITDIPTLQAMKHLFRRCYKTRIKALSELVQEGNDVFASARAKFDADGNELPVAEDKLQSLRERLKGLGLFKLEDLAAYIRATASERQDPSNARCKEWTQDQFKFVDKALHELAHVNPELFDMEWTIDFDAWILDNAASLTHQAVLTHLANGYVYAVERGLPGGKRPLEEGATFLYVRHLANTILNAQDNPDAYDEHHSYPDAQTGSYTSRKLLYPAKGQFTVPPRRTMTRIMDVDNIELMLAEYAKPGGCLNSAQLAENREHVQRMQSGAAEQAAACETCSSLMVQLRSIGPISRKDDLSKADKLVQAAKKKHKDALVALHQAHMLDPAYQVNHTPLILQRFWGAWMDRAATIQDSYSARNAEHSVRQRILQTSRSPYHRHPLALCRDSWEPSIYPALDRMDVRCLRDQGPPLVGHFAVVRAKDQNDAFFIGKITALHRSEAADRKRLLERRDHQLSMMYRQQAPGIVRIPTPPIDPRVARLTEQDELLLRRMQELRRLEVIRDSGKGPPTASAVVELPPPCFEIRASTKASSGVGHASSLGLFATRKIHRGEFIDWYSIFLQPVERYRADRTLSRSYVCALPGSGQVLDGMPMANALTRFVAESADAQARIQLLPASAFEPRAMYAHVALSNADAASMLARFHELPKGCLVNSCAGVKTSENCKRVMHLGFRSMHLDKVPYICASRDIPCGEELLCSYLNAEETSGTWRVHPSAALAAAGSAAGRGLNGSSSEVGSEVSKLRISLSVYARSRCGVPPDLCQPLSSPSVDSRLWVCATAVCCAALQMMVELIAQAAADESSNAQAGLEQLPPMTIQLFEYCKNDMVKLQLTADFWKRRWQQHCEELMQSATRRQAAAAAAGEHSGVRALSAELDSQTAALKPPWLLELFKHIRFVIPSNSRSARQQDITAEQLICWGPSKDIVMGSPYVQLKQKVFEQVRKDLTNTEAPVGAPADPHTAAAAAAASAAASAIDPAQTGKGKRKAASHGAAVTGKKARGEGKPTQTAQDAAAAGTPSGKRQRRAGIAQHLAESLTGAAANPAAATVEQLQSKKAAARKHHNSRRRDTSSESESVAGSSSSSSDGESESEVRLDSDESDCEEAMSHAADESDEDLPLAAFVEHEIKAIVLRRHYKDREFKGWWYLVQWQGCSSDVDDSEEGGNWLSEDSVPEALLRATRFDKGNRARPR